MFQTVLLVSVLFILRIASCSLQKAPTICPDRLANFIQHNCDLIGSDMDVQTCSDLGGCSYGSVCCKSPIPSLDDLAGDWQDVTEVYNHPSVQGFFGGVATTENLLSYTGGTFPPLSQGGESLVLRIDGRQLNATSAKWWPYQVQRNLLHGNFNITSTIRIGFERNVILLQLDVENTGPIAENVELELDLDSFWSYEPGVWQWETPRLDDFSSFHAGFPTSTSFAVTQNASQSVSSAMEFSQSIKHHQAINGSTNRPSFNLEVYPGTSKSLRVTVAVSDRGLEHTLSAAKSTMANFSQIWDDQLKGWSMRYEQALTPDNGFFPGSLPALISKDSKISRLWYHSIISILTTMRTNLLFPRVYGSVGPEYGTTLVYAWDTSLWSSILTLLDPSFLKEQVSLFLKQGVYDGYAVDYVSGQLVGPWYSANDMAIFSTMLNYLHLTGDYDWLKESAANDSTNLAQMEARATKWMSLKDPLFELADYGGLSNLLEEVITYRNMVPSLNAANVWMMEQYAKVLSITGNKTGESYMLSTADSLAASVLSKYAGDGVWYTSYPNHTSQIVKHIYDFDMISVYFTRHLNDSIKSQMLEFAQDELYTGYWMRALSVSDLAANVSMRPDHGSNGAYASWPALAAAGVSQLGNYSRMISYLRSFASVLAESTWAQSYQLLDPEGPEAASRAEAAALWASSISDFSGDYFAGGNGTAPAGLDLKARISLPDQGQTFNENNGASFADVIIRYVFGWNPDGGDELVRDSGVGRGDFEGKLLGIRGPNGQLYDVTASTDGVSVAQSVEASEFHK